MQARKQDVWLLASAVLGVASMGVVTVFVGTCIVGSLSRLTDQGVKTSMYTASTRRDLRNNLWVEASAVSGHVMRMFLDADADGQAETRVLFMAGRPFACTRDLDGDGYHEVIIDMRNRRVRALPPPLPDRGPFWTVDLDARVDRGE